MLRVPDKEPNSVFAPRHDMTPAQQCLAHPRAFAWRVLCGFRANQGLLLAGAIAYYALLSIIPLLILSVIALSHVIPEHELLETIGRYLAWLVPGQSYAVVTELHGFLHHRDGVGWVLLLTMLFFSSLAFAVLENALSVIFVHRIVDRKRSLGMKLLLPYIYVACLAGGLLLVTLVAGGLENLGEYQVDLFAPPAVPAGPGRRDRAADVDLPRDAGRPPRPAPRLARRRLRGAAVGAHA